MGLTVMFLRWRTIVVIGHVGGSHDEMTVGPREAVRSHVILILLKDDSSARNEEALIIGSDRRRYGRIIFG